MRGMRAITIGLTVSLGQAAAFGDPPATEAEKTPPPAQAEAEVQAQPTASGPASSMPPAEDATAAKVPPAEYLKAGARLFNKGEIARASQYLDAAERFRGELTENQKVVLDVYRAEVFKYNTAVARAEAVAKANRQVDPELAPASLTVTMPAEAKLGTGASARSAGPAAAEAPSASSRYATTEPKQRARWLLHEAREFIKTGNLDAADKKLADAKRLPVKWGRLEDTPEKVAKSIAYARSKATPPDSKAPLPRPMDDRPPGTGTPAANPAASGTTPGA